MVGIHYSQLYSILLLLLGDTGLYNVSEIQREKEKARELLQQSAIALDLPLPSVASEYYTAEEMVQFRKRKKRKRKEKFKVDDLVSLDSEGVSRDHGSRKRDTVIGNDESMEVDIKPGQWCVIIMLFFKILVMIGNTVTILWLFHFLLP